MSVKCFDIKRLVKIPCYSPLGIETYISHDSISGLQLRDGKINGIYTTSEYIPTNDPWPLEEFEAEVERAIKQIADDQNAELSEFKQELTKRIKEVKDAELEVKTDKISDYN